MNRKTLRSLAIGFLTSAILSAGFAVFFQGNVPVKGVKIASVLEGNDPQLEQKIETLQDDNEQLMKDYEQLKQDNEQLQSDLKEMQQTASLEASISRESTTASRPERDSDSSDLAAIISQDEDVEAEDEAVDTEEAVTTTDDYDEDIVDDEDYDYIDDSDEDYEEYYEADDADDFVEDTADYATFVISPSDGSSQVAQNLEAQGFITSAEEFEDLMAQWGLETILQTGEHQLHAGMSIHEIAEILTGHVYYYIE